MKASLLSRTHGDFGYRRADVSIGPIFARAMSTHAISAAGGTAHPAPGTEARAGSSRIRGSGGIQQLHRQLAARRLGCVPDPGVRLGPNPPNLSPSTIFRFSCWKRTVVWGLRHDFQRNVSTRKNLHETARPLGYGNRLQGVTSSSPGRRAASTAISAAS